MPRGDLVERRSAERLRTRVGGLEERAWAGRRCRLLEWDGEMVSGSGTSGEGRNSPVVRAVPREVRGCPRERHDLLWRVSGRLEVERAVVEPVDCTQPGEFEVRRRAATEVQLDEVAARGRLEAGTNDEGGVRLE